MSFVPLAEAAKYIMEKEDCSRALEELKGFLSKNPKCAAEVLIEDLGFYGIDRVDFDRLRAEYHVWKELQQAREEQQLREKQSQAGKRMAKHLNRGKTKAAPASGGESLKAQGKKNLT